MNYNGDKAKASLRWSTLQCRREDHVFNLVQKSIAGRCPQCFRNYFTFHKSVCSNNKGVHFTSLLTEFEVRTVSYGPSFFPLAYDPSAKRAGHKSKGKNEDPYLAVRTEKTRIRPLRTSSELKQENQNGTWVNRRAFNRSRLPPELQSSSHRLLGHVGQRTLEKCNS